MPAAAELMVKTRLLVFFLALSLATGTVAGWQLSAQAQAAQDALPAQELQELSEVYALIRRNYVEEIGGDDLIKRAVRGMVASLDPHSAYLSDVEFNNFVEGLTNEEYGGVGTYIGTRDGWIEIISPIYNSPAYRAGIRAGDLVLKIDGESTQGMTVEDAVKKMRGVVGTVLKLEILPRGSGVRPVELVRETIVTPSVLSALVEGGYGYLHITRFQDKTVGDLVNGINNLAEENGAPLRGVVLDLRNNPGGYLLSGVGAAAVFLPQGSTVVIEKGRDTRNKKPFLADAEFYRGLKDRKSLLEVPVVVLVNNGSASASEIVAGALQDHRRGVVVGVRTYGKASVQNLVQLNASKGKSALRLTTARYYTPLDRNIQARGIEPDIEVQQADVVEREAGFTIRESDIAGHLEGENEGESAAGEGAAGVVNEEEVDPSRPPFVSPDDYQYAQALQIVKALAATAQR